VSKKSSSLAHVFTMPSLPAAAARTLQLLQHPQVEPARLARLMKSDPDWAAEILTLAKSPLWGMNGSPADLREAFGQLGLRRFYQLVAVAAVGPLLRRPVPGYGLSGGELWDHSLAVALATREILLERGLRPCEEAFTAALLHDVGKLVLGSALETEPEGVANDELSFEEDEVRVLGIDHAQAGATLLEHWKMPYWLLAAVRSHHAPLENSFLIADLVHLADAICLSAGIGSGRDGLRYRVSRETSLRWNLSRRSVERVLERTLEVLGEAKDFSGAGKGR
jgi:putative nucleotidyltransferase with HDIG domain